MTETISKFSLKASDFVPFGQNLTRPECVWIDSDGIWCSDGRGGVALVHEDRDPDLVGSGIVEPNGFSRRPDGSFVVAGLGDGGVHVIEPDGTTRLLLNSFEGRPLGAVNYACADGPDRVWLSVMTRKIPWYEAIKDPKPDGYILKIEEDGKRVSVAADGLDLTNEVRLSADGKYLYAAESQGFRIVRFPIDENGDLGEREAVGPDNLGPTACPDGFAFDPDGNLWIVMICENGLTVIDTEGEVHIAYQDLVLPAAQIKGSNMASRTATPDMLPACASQTGPLRLPTSIAFGGPDGRTAYIGSLLMPHLATFRLPD